MLTPSRLILYGAESSSQSWRPRWHKGSLSNSRTTLMEAPLTRPCGSGSTARNTRSTSERRMPASSVGRSRPTSNMPVRPDEDSAAGRRVTHRAASAAAISGRGRKTRASRSASVAASRRALSSSTKPPRQERDASANQRRHEPILVPPTRSEGLSTMCYWERSVRPLMAPFYDAVCQEGGPGAVECAPALAGVNVVRPVGR